MTSFYSTDYTKYRFWKTNYSIIFKLKRQGSNDLGNGELEINSIFYLTDWNFINIPQLQDRIALQGSLPKH